MSNDLYRAQTWWLVCIPMLVHKIFHYITVCISKTCTHMVQIASRPNLYFQLQITSIL